jgi:hypothetical protein
MTMTEATKTGMTPMVDSDDLVGSKVYGAIECKIVLVKFRNGREGKDEVRMAILVPGGEVYLFPDRTFERTQAQKWLRDAIVKRLAIKASSETQMIDLTEGPSQV